MPGSQFTMRRMMVEIAFLAVVLAPPVCICRRPIDSVNVGMAAAVIVAWVGLLLFFRWVYRDMPNPFG